MQTTASAPHVNERIQTIVDNQRDAWNRNDPAAWSKDFTDDASFINIRGDLVKGRAAIEKIHAFIFSGPYKATHMEAAVDSFDHAAPGVSVVDVTLELTKFKGLPPGVTATSPGVLRTRFRCVLVEQGGAWKIFAAQNTAIAPQPLA